MPKPAKRNPIAYVEAVVLEDYGLSMSDLVAVIALAHGPAPQAKERPFTNWQAWRDNVRQLLYVVVPETTRAMAMGYSMTLTNYIATVYFGRRRIDNYYHDDIARQIRAARALARKDDRLRKQGG